MVLCIGFVSVLDHHIAMWHFLWCASVLGWYIQPLALYSSMRATFTYYCLCIKILVCLFLRSFGFHIDEVLQHSFLTLKCQRYTSASRLNRYALNTHWPTLQCPSDLRNDSKMHLVMTLRITFWCFKLRNIQTNKQIIFDEQNLDDQLFSGMNE